MVNALIHNLPVIFFFYGLAFFCMGLAISLEVGRSKTNNEFAWALVPLGWFGLVHGAHEWLEMCYIITCTYYSNPGYSFIPEIRLALLSVSFFFLLYFGFRLIVGRKQARKARLLLLLPASIWLVGMLVMFPITAENSIEADVYTRYSLAIPGSALAAWGLILQYQRFDRAGLQSFRWDVLLAALAFLLYGAVGQIFTNVSRLFPSTYINAALFENVFGFPIQLLRAGTACLVTVFIVRSLRSFEVENERRLDVLRAEMLHHTVQAQETERQRIARELHDQTGQSLTALGMGLHGLSEALRADPERALQKAQKLESLSAAGLLEIQRIVSGLRPPQLDDLGLLPALRWYIKDLSERCGVQINLVSSSHLPDLSPEVRVTLFRIAQEALSNSIRHAYADRIAISLHVQNNMLVLTVEDDGIGFDPALTTLNSLHQPCWGLLGMEERAHLVGGSFSLDSQPGDGTRVTVQVPLVNIAFSESHSSVEES